MTESIVGYKLVIPGVSFDESPIWWQNFINYVDSRPRVNGEHKSYYDILKEDYKATHHPGRRDRNEDYIRFLQEEDAVVFKLKWS